MTFLSRRKPRTTAPRRAAGRALDLACLLGVVAAAGTAAAQVPGRAAAPPAGAVRGQPQPAKPAAPAASSSGGKVMYFYKPADALVPVSGSGGSEPVAQADLPPIPVPPAHSLVERG